MILNVTEEQKKVIEEHGHMVIEFKKWCSDISVRITDVWNAIIFYLQQFVERPKYHFIRSLGRKYQPNFSYKVIYHRCRDRC